jgi:hypothetical protein
MTRLEQFRKQCDEQRKKIAEAKSVLETEERELRKLVLENLGVDPSGGVTIESVVNLVTNTVRMMGEKVDG